MTVWQLFWALLRYVLRGGRRRHDRVVICCNDEEDRALAFIGWDGGRTRSHVDTHWLALFPEHADDVDRPR